MTPVEVTILRLTMATKICKLDAVESPPAHQPSAVNFGSRIHGIQIPTL